MALDALKNFALTTVSTGYNAAATTIVLTGGGGALFPAVPFNAVWWNGTDYPNPSLDPNVEIVRVTAISTDTLTITRAQESTSASTKNTATKTYNFQQSVTAKIITDIDTAKVNTTVTISTTAPITGGGDLSTNRTFAMAASSDSVDGYLTAADHTTFNAKQATITGTANQIIKTGAVLSTPQDIATSSTPQFARMGIGQAADGTIPLVVLKAGLSVTPADGLELINTTAAAAGAQQVSPSIHLSSQGWKTTATAASQSEDWYIYSLPVQGAANPSANLLIYNAVNGGANVLVATFGSGGTLAMAGNVSSSAGSLFAASSSVIGVTTRSRLASSGDGLFEISNNAQTAFTALNFGGTSSSFPQLRVSGTTLQHRLADNSADGAMSAAAGTFSGTLTSNGDLTLAVAKKLSVTSGTNQRAGNTTLVGGTVTVSNTTVTANTIVMLTRKTSGGTIGTAITYTVSAATSFTVNSDNILDTSTFSYLLIEVP